MFLYEVIVLVSLSFGKILSLIFSLVWLFTYAKAITMFTFNDPLAMKTVKRTCVSSLVGVAFLVFKILSLFSFLQIFLLGHRRQKFNQSELAQKIYTRRDLCQVHVHQFWWAWPLRFRR